MIPGKNDRPFSPSPLPSEEPKEPAGEPAVQGRAVSGAGHLLVIDDEECVRGYLANALPTLGYTVWTCESGLEAIDYYRDHHQEVDLVILDLIMPGMGGPATFEALRRIDPETPVLILSGLGDSEATEAMLARGALAVLNKPFRLTMLSRTVAQHLRRSREGD